MVRPAFDWMSSGLPIEGQIGNQASKWCDDCPPPLNPAQWKADIEPFNLLSTMICSERESEQLIYEDYKEN